VRENRTHGLQGFDGNGPAVSEVLRHNVPMRIMTWNSLGMESAKQGMLKTFIASQTIDYTFIQEGDPGFDNVEFETGLWRSTLVFDDSDDAMKLLKRCAPSSTLQMGPLGGVGRAQVYNVVGAGFSKVGDAAALDYLGSANIKRWLTNPAKYYIDHKREATIAGKPIWTPHKLFLPNGTGDRNFREGLDANIVRPVQTRVNMLGHRRPKAINIAAPALRIYYWHAPLGPGEKLEKMGLKNYADLSNDGCGGTIAVLANILFSRYIGAETKFPDNTILLGDLNINEKAVKKIYSTANVITSHDGWCHAIADSSLPLTTEVTTLDESVLGHSDHAPIVFTCNPT
jgi:hypothetical protein